MPARFPDATLLRRSPFGDLYRSIDPESRREVVVRRLFDSDHAAAHPDEVMAIERRAERLAMLSHPNVASVIGGGADGDGGYLASEWVEGADLTTIVSNAALTPGDFTKLASQTLAGLASIHDHGLAHGSLQPRRVVITWTLDQSACFVITDLGLAELLGSADLVTTDDRGHYNGALDCLAPELFDGQGGDHRSDLYALGNIFYYALSQHMAFAGETAEATIARHRAGEAVPLTRYRADLPEGLAEWIMHLLARSPEDRPASAGEALQQLGDIMGFTPAPAMPPASEPAATPAAETEPSATEATEATEVAVPAEPEPTPPTERQKTAKVGVQAPPASDDALEDSPDEIEVADENAAGNRRLVVAVIAIAVLLTGALAAWKFWPGSQPSDTGETIAMEPGPTGTPEDPPPSAPTPPAPSPALPTAGDGPGSGASAALLDPNLPPVTESLIAQFTFGEIGDLAAADDAAAGEDVTEWPLHNGFDGISSLTVAGVDPASGSVARRLLATPDQFPALPRPHNLLHLTGDARLEVAWQRDSDDFLAGDQLTYVVVFWSPEPDADLIRLNPPLKDEAAIFSRLAGSAVVSEIRYFDKAFPLVPYPHGNQLIGLTVVWAGTQDNARHGILTAGGKRFDSRLSEAPNLALLMSSVTLGGNTGKLSEGRNSGVYFAELLIYDRALSADERVQLDGYLATKYFR